MLMFQWTGTKRWYFVPWVEVGRQQDGDGMWYVQLRFLKLEWCLYSLKLADRIITHINESPFMTKADQELVRTIRIKPPRELLISMACRLDHSFPIRSERSMESALADMSKVYEEVAGTGFYKYEDVPGVFKGE